MTATIRVPFDVSHTGRIAMAEEEYDVANQYIKTLLLTRLGERIMRPRYGSRVRDHVFEPIDEVMLQSIEGEIRDAIRIWEPAIEIRRIDFEDYGSLVEVDVQYNLGSTIGIAPSTVRVTIDAGGSVEEMER